MLIFFSLDGYVKYLYKYINDVFRHFVTIVICQFCMLYRLSATPAPLGPNIGRNLYPPSYVP